MVSLYILLLLLERRCPKWGWLPLLIHNQHYKTKLVITNTIQSTIFRAQYNGLLGRGGRLFLCPQVSSWSGLLSVSPFSSSALLYCQRRYNLDNNWRQMSNWRFCLLQLFMISISGVSLFKTNTIYVKKEILACLQILKIILAPLHHSLKWFYWR